MKNIVDPTKLLYDYGPKFYRAATPEYVASQCAGALPGADLAVFNE